MNHEKKKGVHCLRLTRLLQNVIERPMDANIINLNEIPDPGREYLYSDVTAELTPSVDDLIGKNPYELKVRIQPIGNAYQVTGSLTCALDLICSRCAIDFKFPVKQEINEILIIEEKRPRGGRSAKSNHSSEWLEDGPYCTSLESEYFNMGEFLREIIALAEPLQPMGKGNCDESCENYQRAIAKGWLKSPNSPDLDFPDESSPFDVLKTLKN